MDNKKRKPKQQMYCEKKPNNFMKLRYRQGDNPQNYPSMSIDEFSDTVLDGLSKGIIGKLESNDYDPKNPPCKASTLRLYHDNCGCSFDYLMGETKYKSPELKELGKDPALSKLDESFWNNLKSTITDGFGCEAIMLNALFHNSDALQILLEQMFKSLLRMNNIKKSFKGKALKESLDYNIALEEFSLNKVIDSFLEEQILPLLESEFYVYENKTKPMLDSATDEIWDDFMNHHKENHEYDFTHKNKDSQ